MQNTLNVDVSTKNVVYVGGLKQWDYGYVLNISGCEDYGEKTEVHFSLNATGGEAVRCVATLKDGILAVKIPCFVYQATISCNYYAYAFIYPSDETTGQTVKTIVFPIIARPKPIGFVPPDGPPPKPPHKGEIGEFTEIFNDYENNIAGIMGYYWADVDFSGEHPVIEFSHLQGVSDGEPFEIDYEVGDIISIVNNNHWTNCSTILAIENNFVTVDSLPFEKVSVPSPVTPDDYSVFVVDKPFSGIVRLGRFAKSSGEGCAAYERAGDAGGRDTRVLGQYGFTRGRDTVADYCAFADGKDAKALGKTSFAFGTGPEAIADGAIAFGLHTIATVAQQMALGRLNIKDAEGIYALIFGNGTYSKRSNAFTLDWDGNAWLSGDIKIGGKGYFDPNADTLLTERKAAETISSIFATYALKPLVNGLTAELSIKPFYDMGIDSFDLSIDGKVLGLVTPINEKARIAAEILKSNKTHIVFYGGGEKICETSITNTLTNCGMLFVTEETTEEVTENE